MMAVVSVSVVMPSASRAEALGRTLSVLRRELPDVPLFVVVDGAGHPGVAETVQAHAGHLVTADSVGPAAARNLGAAKTDTEWVLFLDDDVVLQPGAGAVMPELAASPALAVVGALKAPDAAPAWLVDTYKHGSMARTAAGGASTVVDACSLTCALALVRRSTWAEAGGFPQVAVWGWEDSLFGLRIQRIAAGTDWLMHDPRLAGVHEFIPTWEQWLSRQRTAGERLYGVAADLPEAEREQLLHAVVLGEGPRAAVKAALGRLPIFIWRTARGSLWRHAAAAASFAAGYRAAARAR